MTLPQYVDLGGSYTYRHPYQFTACNGSIAMTETQSTEVVAPRCPNRIAAQSRTTTSRSA